MILLPDLYKENLPKILNATFELLCLDSVELSSLEEDKLSNTTFTDLMNSPELLESEYYLLSFPVSSGILFESISKVHRLEDDLVHLSLISDELKSIRSLNTYLDIAGYSVITLEKGQYSTHWFVSNTMDAKLPNYKKNSIDPSSIQATEFDSRLFLLVSEDGYGQWSENTVAAVYIDENLGHFRRMSTFNDIYLDMSNYKSKWFLLDF